VQKSNGVKIRKLPLPLEIRFGNGATITDGLFSLSSKEASRIRIIDIDNEKYATIEIYPPIKEKPQTRNLADIFEADTLIGTDLAKSKGLGKNVSQYKIYRRPDRSLYAVIEGGNRPRKLQLGNPLERNSPIAIIARAIKQNFNSNEFSKNQLIPLIPKSLTYGQTLKAAMDAMTAEGYTQKTQKTDRGRLKETFKATPKLTDILVTPEQA